MTERNGPFDEKDGALKIFRAGQQGYVVEWGGRKLGLDLFLTPSERRLVGNFFEPEDLGDFTLLFGSHDHDDHIDREAWVKIAGACPKVKFVAPAYFEETLPGELHIPSSRFLFVDETRPAEYGGIGIRAVAAAHEFLDTDPDTGLHPYLCYDLELGPYRIFHAGDTCRYDGLAEKILRLGAPDIAFLPINGRDAKRYASGCIGNMTYQEAADLAGDIAPGLTIPGHFDMFANNLENPELFGDYMRVKYPALRVRILPAGTSLVYRKEE